MIWAASYCRVSTDRADQAHSFESQKRYFQAQLAQKPGWALYRVYADEGITGTSTKKRAEFRRMMEDARAGRFQWILTKEVSRFSRNILDTIAYTRELKKLGVGVLFLGDAINTMEPDAELRLSIMASIAQEESRRTSARVKWGQTRRMEQGVVFGRGPLGYRLREGTLEIEPEGAAVVRGIFTAYAEAGQSCGGIARELERRGIRTASGGARWSPGQVWKILSNEKYVGDLLQKKTFTPDYLTHEKKRNTGEEPLVFLADHHPAIVSRDLWRRVQEERARRNPAQEEMLPGGCACQSPLGGRIRCGVCGAAFVRKKKHTEGGTIIYWRCARAAKGDGGCRVGHLLRQELAEELFLSALRHVWGDPRTLEERLNAAVRAGISREMEASLCVRIRELARMEMFSGQLCRKLLRQITIFSDGGAAVALSGIERAARFRLTAGSEKDGCAG